MDTQRFEHAVQLRDSGHLTDALREFATLADSTADSEEKASILLNQVRCYRLLGRIEEARQQLQAIIHTTPTTEILLYLSFEESVLRWHEGKRGEAVQILDSLQRDYASLLVEREHQDLHQQIQLSRGMLLTELTRYTEAVPLLEQCLSSLSTASTTIDMGALFYNLALCYLSIGEPDRARGKFLETLKSGAHGAYIASTHYYLGIIYSREGAPAKALQEFKQCLDHAEEGQIPKQHIYTWLATVSYDLGLKSDAERYERLSKK